MAEKKQEKSVTLPPETIARLEQLLANDDAHGALAHIQGILTTIGDLPERGQRIAALAFVLEGLPYAAHLPPTTSLELPNVDEDAVTTAIKADQAALNIEQKFHDGLHASPAPAPVIAERILARLESLTSNDMRIFTLGRVFKCMDGVVQPEMNVADIELPNDEFDRRIWRNRRALTLMKFAFSGDALKTKTGAGRAVLAALATIEDEKDRALILGQLLDLRQQRRPSAIDMLCALMGQE